MIEILFWSSMGSFLYAYFGYPLSLFLIGFFFNQKVRKTFFFPYTTMVITAYNEEKRIAEKLQNTLNLQYPKEKLQIIVASDGSTDRTNEILRNFQKNEVELLEILERKGKESAQKAACKKARGDVIVFTDVATTLDPEALKEIVANFADPLVGCVSSEDRLIGKDGKPCGEGLYVRYEMWLRRLESKVNSLVGLSGSFFAARKEVCQDLSAEMQSDFRTVLSSVKKGLRGISDRKVIGYYEDISDQRNEMDRKIRTVIRGLTVFFRHLEFLNFIRYGFFSYQYFCHKLLRWVTPLFLFVAFFANAILASDSLFFFLVFIGQSAFYIAAVMAWKMSALSQKTLMKVPMYFLIVNISILVAWYRYLRGKRVVMWAPSER